MLKNFMLRRKSPKAQKMWAFLDTGCVLLRELYCTYAKTAAAKEADVVVEAAAPPPAALPARLGQLASSWDEEDDDESAAALAPTLTPDPAVDYASEFERCFPAYRREVMAINWPETFPELELKEGFGALDLVKANVIKVFASLKNKDPERTMFGFLPYMATHSRGSVGSLLASSFAERINSAANIIVTKGNTLLSEEMIDMCTTLRMNRDFMVYMREHYGHISLQQFRMTVVREANHLDDADQE
jgi:hypothetical protein